MSKKVLGVGHCGFDAPRIARVVAEAGAEFVNVNDCAQALAVLKDGSFALVLPNRVIQGDEEGGLKVVQTIKADSGLVDTPVMLISGISSAQQAAEAAGAVPGFGKDALESGGAGAAIALYL